MWMNAFHFSISAESGSQVAWIGRALLAVDTESAYLSPDYE